MYFIDRNQSRLSFGEARSRRLCRQKSKYTFGEARLGVLYERHDAFVQQETSLLEKSARKMSVGFLANKGYEIRAKERGSCGDFPTSFSPESPSHFNFIFGIPNSRLRFFICQCKHIEASPASSRSCGC